MKTLLLFLTIYFSAVSSFAQDTINKTDASGRKQGYWIKKDIEGKKIYEGQFNQDVPYGKFKYYYPEGQLKAVSELSEGGKRSKTVAWFRNGKKMAEGVYINEKKDSTWRFFSEIDEVLVSKEFYKDGKKEGISETYYPDGVVAERSTWKNGARTGSWEQFYTDGKPKLKCAYREDLKDGPLTTYHISGRVWVTGQYVNGEADGTWTYLTDTGQVEKKEYYKTGLLIKTDEFIKKESK